MTDDRGSARRECERALPARASVLLGGLLMAGALVLYQPALHVGLLSDDFALVEWARAGDIAPRSWQYLRPTLFILWAPLLAVVPSAGEAVALHLLSIALHAGNATLLATVLARLGASSRVAFVAAVLLLCFPVLVEPVVWPSALSDLLLAMLVLLTVLAASTAQWRWGTAATIVMLLSAALLSKETAVAAPLLFLALAALATPFRASYLKTAVLAAALTALYLLARMNAGPITNHPGMSPAALVPLFTNLWPSLVLPFHESVRHDAPLLVAAWSGALMVLALFAIAGLRPNDWRVAAIAGAWTVAAVLPTVGLFAVMPDLQGSRYLYLASPAWSAVLALSLERTGRQWRAVGPALATLLLAILVTVSVLTTRAHVRHWQDAALLRDVVVSAIATLPTHCQRAVVHGAPDNHRGAYVARNALDVAVRELSGRALELAGRAEDVPPQCRIDLTDLVITVP